MSHCTEQQEGSTTHTSSQQARSKHPGLPCGKKQLPDSMSPQPLQRLSARVTQSASQPMSQQLGSTVHTLPQQASSEQPGFGWTAKQLPLAVEQTVLKVGFGVSAQFEAAIWVQVKSHVTRQQNPSMVQTLSQQTKSLQPGAR